MTRFTNQNTEGYSDAELGELNRRFDAECTRIDPDDSMSGSTYDHIAEQVLADYDNKNA